MIYDKVENLTKYLGLSKNIDSAISYIQNTDITNLPRGKTEIDRDNVFVNHFSYQTLLRTEDETFENHVEYIDLHVIVSGEEAIDVAPVETLILLQENLGEDALLYSGKAELNFHMNQYTFLLVYPGEAHVPKVAYKKSECVDKLVFKIRV